MGQLLHGSATTTEAVRRAIQRSEESVRALARRYGISPTTVQKWRKRSTATDAPMGPKEARSTVLTPDEEAIIIAFSRHTLLPPDDCLYGLQPTILHLTRSSLHRCPVRLTRELRERGYEGGYTAVKRFVAAIRPSDGPKPFEVRFETPAGHQARVDFARFLVTFEDEPGVTRIIWLFSLVLAIPGTSSPASFCIRICRRSCAATWRPSRRSAACRSRSSTTE